MRRSCETAVGYANPYSVRESVRHAARVYSWMSPNTAELVSAWRRLRLRHPRPSARRIEAGRGRSNEPPIDPRSSSASPARSYSIRRRYLAVVDSLDSEDDVVVLRGGADRVALLQSSRKARRPAAVRHLRSGSMWATGGSSIRGVLYPGQEWSRERALDVEELRR
jgi:hypothetical protein